MRRLELFFQRGGRFSRSAGRVENWRYRRHDLRKNRSAEEGSPHQEAETERETVKNPGPECTVLFAGEPVYRFTIHSLPPSS